MIRQINGDRDGRLLPAAVLAWAGVLAVLYGGTTGSLIAGGCAVAIMVIAVRKRRTGLVAAAVVALIFVVGAGIRVAAMDRSPVREYADAQAIARIEVRLSADARFYPARGPRPQFAIRQAELRGIDVRGRHWRLDQPIILTGTGSQAEALRAPVVGSIIESRVRLGPVERTDRAVATARIIGQPRMLSPPTPLDQRVESVRGGLRAAVADHPPERRGLVPALVVGDTSNFPQNLEAQFQATALTHLTAVSGANLTLMLAFLLTVARWVGVRGWWLRAIGPIGVLIFIALCRTEPSVLRAAAMGLVGLAGLGLSGRARRGLRPLCVAIVALLAIDPWLAGQAGFALSVLATAGIVWWAGPWSNRLAGWLPRPLAEALAVPLSAQIATQPLVTALSGQISIVGLLANALAGPLVGPATVSGFLAAGLSQIHPLPATLAGFVAAWCAQGIIAIAVIGATLPGAAIDWSTDPVALMIIAGLCVAAGAGMGLVLGRRWLCLALIGILIMVGLRGPVQLGWPPPGWAVVGCDVGQGDAFVVRTGPDSAIVVDAGPKVQAVDQCLDQLGIDQVPMLILSHGHSDHVDGVAGVIDGRRVGTVLVSARSAGVGRDTALALSTARPRMIGAQSGESYRVGTVSVEVLAPLAATGSAVPAAGAESGAENDVSLVLRIRSGELTVIFTGDVEPAGQSALLRAGTDLRGDVLKVPHHGSSRQDDRFLAATGAKIALASAGQDNEYGHPTPRTLDTLRRLGMTIGRTDIHGAVGVAVDVGRPRLYAERRDGATTR